MVKGLVVACALHLSIFLMREAFGGEREGGDHPRGIRDLARDPFTHSISWFLHVLLFFYRPFSLKRPRFKGHAFRLFWGRWVRGAGLPGLRHGVRLSRGAWELEGEVAGSGAVARKPGPGGMSQAPRAPPKAERGARRLVPLTVRGTDRHRGRAIPCQRCSSLPPTLIFNLFGKFQTYQLCEEET